MCYFEQKGIAKRNADFSAAECSAFFAYYVYYIQIRNQHHKPERLRDVQGLAETLAVVFGGLALLGAFACGLYCVCRTDAPIQLILDFVCWACAVILVLRYRCATENRIHMVLAIYDVSVDKEFSEGRTVF